MSAEELSVAIDLFEMDGSRAALVAILRAIATRLPHIAEDLTPDDYQDIYGWGGQG